MIGGKKGRSSRHLMVLFGLALALMTVRLGWGAESTAELAVGNEPGLGFGVDYPVYFSGHDIVYLSPPVEGWEGFPLGNGDLGGMI